MSEQNMTSTWLAGQRPLTIAVLAMGGEGGGVLSNWIADTGRKAGWITQNTSVAGVAQRTGATVYYIEMVPPSLQATAGSRRRPVLSTMATPGQVDIVIASELMEAGRAVQRGFVTPDRTTLIASTNRVYSIDEKSRLGDGRVDSEELLRGARSAAKVLVSADFNQLALEARSVISASLFGAFAGSGACPFSRDECEDMIRTMKKGVESSLRAFDLGFEAARAAVAPPAPERERVFLSLGTRPKSPEEQAAEEDARLTRIAQDRPRELVGPALAPLADRVGREIPVAARLMVLRGLERTALYQNVAYAEQYLDRVRPFVALEQDPAGSATLLNEVARWTALWMCYQDTIQVALQKVRQDRLEGIRAEAKAADDQPIEVREYLHPQLEEITDTLPVGIGRTLRKNKAFAKIVHAVANKGLVLNTTSVPGYTVLSTLARLRPIRPRSLRFAHEQTEIETWLALVAGQARTDYSLACATAACAQVLKGYGETWERGKRSFAALIDQSRRLAGRSDAAETLGGLRKAALRDEDGTELQAALAALESAQVRR